MKRYLCVCKLTTLSVFEASVLSMFECNTDGGMGGVCALWQKKRLHVALTFFQFTPSKYTISETICERVLVMFAKLEDDV